MFFPIVWCCGKQRVSASRLVPLALGRLLRNLPPPPPPPLAESRALQRIPNLPLPIYFNIARIKFYAPCFILNIFW